MPNTIPADVQKIADDLDLNLVDFVESKNAIDFDHLFAWMRSCSGDQRDEALSEINAHYDDIDVAIENAEAEVADDDDDDKPATTETAIKE